jgi:hypothetical protein
MADTSKKAELFGTFPDEMGVKSVSRSTTQDQPTAGAGAGATTGSGTSSSSGSSSSWNVPRDQTRSSVASTQRDLCDAAETDDVPPRSAEMNVVNSEDVEEEEEGGTALSQAGLHLSARAASGYRGVCANENNWKAKFNVLILVGLIPSCRRPRRTPKRRGARR